MLVWVLMHSGCFHAQSLTCVVVDCIYQYIPIRITLFQRELERLYGNEELQLDHRSCEMIAEELINYIEDKYPNRAVRVEVYEDDENGAILENDLFV